MRFLDFDDMGKQQWSASMSMSLFTKITAPVAIYEDQTLTTY